MQCSFQGCRLLIDRPHHNICAPIWRRGGRRLVRRRVPIPALQHCSFVDLRSVRPSKCMRAHVLPHEHAACSCKSVPFQWEKTAVLATILNLQTLPLVKVCEFSHCYSPPRPCAFVGTKIAVGDADVVVSVNKLGLFLVVAACMWHTYQQV